MMRLRLAHWLGVALLATTTTVAVEGQPAASPAAAGARPPAASLTRPTTITAVTDAAGFLRRWLVLEPIPVTNQLTEAAVRTAITTHALGDAATLPHDGDVATIGTQRLTWHAFDSRGYNLNLFHFAYALDKPTSNVLFWVTTVVHVPRDLAGVRLAIGSNAASVWWVDGQEVIALYNDRQSVIDDGVSKRLTWRKGPHVIRAAIVNAGGATDFCARVLDERGEPITDLTVALTADPPPTPRAPRAKR